MSQIRRVGSLAESQLKFSHLFNPRTTPPRQAWLENFGPEKRLTQNIELHPRIFGVFPGLDHISNVLKWQNSYRNIDYVCMPTRNGLPGGTRKPWPQEGTRHGSTNSPIFIKGGRARSPRGPVTSFTIKPHFNVVNSLLCIRYFPRSDCAPSIASPHSYIHTGPILNAEDYEKAKRYHLDPNQRGYPPAQQKKPLEKIWLNSASIAILMFAATFAAVPLYRLYCQTTGKGGQAFKDEENKIVAMKKDESRLITVKFNTAPHSSIAWNFEPLQDKIVVHPGETALAFYRATNPLDELAIGVATYTVLPYEAGVYFNKIQCFCFEEQMLQPKEDVFMPVLFYIDPEFSKDPQLGSTNELVLSYTFFRSKDGELI